MLKEHSKTWHKYARFSNVWYFDVHCIHLHTLLQSCQRALVSVSKVLPIESSLDPDLRDVSWRIVKLLNGNLGIVKRHLPNVSESYIKLILKIDMFHLVSPRVDFIKQFMPYAWNVRSAPSFFPLFSTMYLRLTPNFLNSLPDLGVLFAVRPTFIKSTPNVWKNNFSNEKWMFIGL
jgi:hypothetical protein